MTVTESYVAVGLMAILGILFPLSQFIVTRFFRPVTDSANPNITKSYFLPGYERDHSMYPRRLSTYECGSEPVGGAMIQFHFQYYWYAIIFLVFDIAFMFLALAGTLTMNAGVNNARHDDAVFALAIAGIFLLLMSLGVWHVFRKRGRIYI
ncbi:MAG TPA: NADH-quinone oxidoreductase subunit A [Candidatus Poseidoniaceae archaeon]|jgi:NADH:ubiquinone oxidoreductase subunit 3 (subunit A)|nr:NADH-quinone oxidoreductase subunit A [Candidatus Poseidoniaceae archaeon]